MHVLQRDYTETPADFKGDDQDQSDKLTSTSNH